MGTFFRLVDQFLRGRARFAVGAPIRGQLKWLLAFVLAFGIFYGAVMGAFSGLAPGRLHQLLYSGVKVPVLLLLTFALCLPSFFVLNSVLGLREDLAETLKAVVATQACVTIVLGCLAPVTALWYASCGDYSLAVFFNGVMFAVASFTAQVVMVRYYRPLIRRERRHAVMIVLWLCLYVFVGIQMGWVLRPFIGDPAVPVAFFRSDAWGNAYVVIGRLTAHFFRRLFGG